MIQPETYAIFAADQSFTSENISRYFWEKFRMEQHSEFFKPSSDADKKLLDLHSGIFPGNYYGSEHLITSAYIRISELHYSGKRVGKDEFDAVLDLFHWVRACRSITGIDPLITYSGQMTQKQIDETHINTIMKPVLSAQTLTEQIVHMKTIDPEKQSSLALLLKQLLKFHMVELNNRMRIIMNTDSIDMIIKRNLSSEKQRESVTVFTRNHKPTGTSTQRETASKKSGKRDTLTGEQTDEIQRIISISRPRGLGLDSDHWNVRSLREWINQEFNLNYRSDSSYKRIFKTAGFIYNRKRKGYFLSL